MTAPDAHGWLPIDTAPRDGSEVLLAFGGYDTVPPLSASWVDDLDAWCIAGTLAAFSAVPTHWQPLPEPPVIFAAGGTA